ncbi:MAG: flagellar basal body-associated FliL family protein [Herbinix sp.]|nr:flagellar basal body-associated FliL family protein [Herbinix sp.]
MKKNILTIIIMAIVLINTVLTGFLIFVIVPTSNKTNELVTKVSSIINLELESPNEEDQISIADIESYPITDKLTINLASDDGTDHYMTVNVTLSENTKNEDYLALSEKVASNEDAIKEIISDAFSQYTKDEVKPNKEAIRTQILTGIQEYFNSDFIINVSFGNLIIE